ncbi:hypothetical protein V6N13_012796 [Hibiscus sabdariffa]|uniref:Uncharacterized protein n=1 Tax=Hibiscus sabdariffa TaxID=183260 RepID=A0ABR2SH63_9ROSI
MFEVKGQGRAGQGRQEIEAGQGRQEIEARQCRVLQFPFPIPTLTSVSLHYIICFLFISFCPQRDYFSSVSATQLPHLLLPKESQTKVH